MFELIRSKTQNAKNDIISGITVALALVPEAVAFPLWRGWILWWGFMPPLWWVW